MTAKARKEWIVTSTEMGVLLGVTKQRIGQLVKDGMPRHAPGKYNAPECIAWKFQQSEERMKSSNLEKHKIKEITARTHKLNLDASIKKGSLIRYEDAKRLVLSNGVYVVNELQAIPGRIQTTNDIKILITNECRESAKRIADNAGEQAKSLKDCGKFIGDT